MKLHGDMFVEEGGTKPPLRRTQSHTRLFIAVKCRLSFQQKRTRLWPNRPNSCCQQHWWEDAAAGSQWSQSINSAVIDIQCIYSGSGSVNRSSRKSFIALLSFNYTESPGEIKSNNYRTTRDFTVFKQKCFTGCMKLFKVHFYIKII